MDGGKGHLFYLDRETPSENMRIDKKDLLTFDFESFYSKDYSLRLQSYNTSEYIRDPQFLIHGVGIKDGTADTIWVTGHDESLRGLEYYGYEERPVCAHNTAFDAFICHQHADLHPAMYCDTLSMARATIGHHLRHNLDTVAPVLGYGTKMEGALAETKGLRILPPEILAKLGEYCVRDVDLCHKIFWHLYEYMPEDEMELINLTLKMFCEPKLLIMEDEVAAEWENEKLRKQKKLDESGRDISQFTSAPKFAAMLEAAGGVVPMKKSPTTGKQTYAFAKTDPGFKKLLVGDNETVRLLTETRLVVKSNIRETRAKRLLKAGEQGQNVPVLLNFAGAHTFRWSGGNSLNFQNFPRGGALRKAIVAPPGHQLLVYDLSQIEARLTVWFCGQEDVLQAFRDFDLGIGPDVYKVMASRLFDTPIGEIDDAQRFLGKASILGLNFGLGWKRLQTQLAIGFLGAAPIDMPDYEAKRIVGVYRAANPRVVGMWDRLGALAQSMSRIPTFDKQYKAVRFLYRMIELPSGLALKYPGLSIEMKDSPWGPREQLVYDGRYGRKMIWGAGFLENGIQALARCVISEQMLKIRWPIATMTHDEVLVVVPDNEIKIAEKEVYNIMATPPIWAPDLPLALEGGYDRRYSK